jgi:hypothetical protein
MLEQDNYGMTDMAMNQGRYHGDETLLVRFFMNPRINTIKTKTWGRPIYEEVPYVQIMQPGNKDSIIIRPATKRDKGRFAEHYRKFEAREDQEAIEGTLLAEWAGVTRSQVEELKYLNVRTVEQLAAMSDSNATGVMGAGFLKQKAQKYLDDTDGNATAEALAEMQAKYDALIAQMHEINAKPEPKPKRKRRSSAEVKAEKEAKLAAAAAALGEGEVEFEAEIEVEKEIEFEKEVEIEVEVEAIGP